MNRHGLPASDWCRLLDEGRHSRLRNRRRLWTRHRRWLDRCVLWCAQGDRRRLLARRRRRLDGGSLRGAHSSRDRLRWCLLRYRVRRCRLHNKLGWGLSKLHPAVFAGPSKGRGWVVVIVFVVRVRRVNAGGPHAGHAWRLNGRIPCSCRCLELGLLCNNVRNDVFLSIRELCGGRGWTGRRCFEVCAKHHRQTLMPPLPLRVHVLWKDASRECPGTWRLLAYSSGSFCHP